MCHISTSDEVLIKRILENRDTDAYSEIVSRYKNAVFKICVSITGNYHTAEDISQETFIDGYMKLALLKEHDKLLPWLTKIARNKCYNYLTRSAHLRDCEIGECENIPDLFDNSPEMSVIQNDDNQRITQAISRLPDEIKTAVRLYYFQYKTVKQTAEILKVSERVIKYRLSEARKKLKKELDYMNTDKDYTLSSDFEKKLKENVEELKNYYFRNMSEDGKKKLYDETLAMVEKIPESKEKHNMLASIYRSAPSDVKVDKDEIKKHAELGENSDILGDILLDEIIYSSRASDDEQIKKLTDEAIPKLDALGNHDKKANCLFWRGTRYFAKKDYVSAKKDFEDSIKDFDVTKSGEWIANAYAGIRLCDIASKSINTLDIDAYQLCSETLQYKDGKLLFISQPGVCAGNDYSEILFRYSSLFYYLSRTNKLLFDENMKPGESLYIEEDGKKSLTFISNNEIVTLESGTFTDCIKVTLTCSPKQGNYEYYSISYTVEAWYAKDIGLVKADFKAYDGREEVYELSEYKINGGSGYMPFEKGNLWRYKNVNLPEYYQHIIEREIIECNDGSAHMTSLDYITIDEKCIDSLEVDSEICIGAVDSYYEKFNFAKAAEILSAVVRRNDSANLTSMALTLIDNITRLKGYYEKKYKNIFSGVWGRNITKSDDIIKYGDVSHYIRKPYEGVSEWEQVTTWGLEVLRNLYLSAGTLYSTKWVDGYKETLHRDKVDIDITAENAGTVSVKCGTFENCIKLTIEEKEFRESENAVVVVSIKSYWFAPEVGIIREYYKFRNIDFTCDLTDYHAISGKGEYMPLHISNYWVYEPVECKPEYIARIEFRIENGMSDTLFTTYQFELFFKGTNEEYRNI